MYGLTGYFGSGKTLNMTKLLLRDHQEGRFVVTNYTTSFSNVVVGSLPEFVKILEEIFILKNHGKEIGDVISQVEKPSGFISKSLGRSTNYQKISIGLDEAGIYFNSRAFAEWKNYPYLVDFMLQCRKLDVRIYYTVQHPLYVDVNFRRVTEVWRLYKKLPFIPASHSYDYVLDPENPDYRNPIDKLGGSFSWLGEQEVWNYYGTKELAMKYKPDDLKEDYQFILNSKTGNYFRRLPIHRRFFPNFVGVFDRPQARSRAVGRLTQGTTE